MRIHRYTPPHLTGAQKQLYDTVVGGPRAQGPQHFALTDESGALNGPFNAFLMSPRVGAALQEVGVAIRYQTALTDRQREIAILLVAGRWDSSFERDSHEKIARAIGVTDAELASLRAASSDAFAGAEALVVRTVSALLDGDLDDAQWDAAASVLGPEEVFELTALVGYYATLALQLRVFRV